MKLSIIAENHPVVRDAARAMGALVRHIKQFGNDGEKKALGIFLKAPSAASWGRTKWLLDSAIQANLTDRSQADNLKAWSELKSLTDPVVAAAVYDMEPGDAKQTPLQGKVLSRQNRDKYKLALGPQGFVGTMANADKMGTNRTRQFLKDIAKQGTQIAKDARKDIPGVRPTGRF